MPFRIELYWYIVHVEDDDENCPVGIINPFKPQRLALFYIAGLFNIEAIEVHLVRSLSWAG